MLIWKFTIRQKGNEPVQGVGFRPIIVSELLGAGVKRGDATNSRDGKSVEVVFECDSLQAARELKNRLLREIKLQRRASFTTLPRSFSVSKISKVNSLPPVPAVMGERAAALTLSQLHKGVASIDKQPSEMSGMRRAKHGMRKDQKGEMHGMRTEMHGMRKDLKGEMHGMRTDLKGEMHGMRSDLKGEMHGMRKDLKGEMHGMRTDLKGEMHGMHTGLKGEMHSMRKEMKSGFDRVVRAIKS